MKDQISADVKAALKAGDRLAVDACRMLLAALKNEEIDRRRPLTDEEALAVVNRAVKTRQDAIALYEKGGRPELADKERREIEIIRRYLPRQLSEEELARAVEEVIRDVGATSKKDLGRVMKEVIARHPGRVDGRLASQIAGSRLA